MHGILTHGIPASQVFMAVQSNGWLLRWLTVIHCPVSLDINLRYSESGPPASLNRNHQLETSKNMFPVLGNILSQIYYICALIFALSGRLVAILGSYILAVRPPLQSLPITRQILLFIHSVCLSWPTHGLSVSPRTFGNEVSVLLWAVYRPILSLLDNI